MDALVTHSRTLIENGSKSFAGAAKLFPADVRDSAFLLYAWCRHCDDVIDDQVLGFAKAEASLDTPQARLAYLTEHTERALVGQPEGAVFEALARVAADRDIPAIHPREMLQGFRMDVEEHTYDTLDDTLRYCYHVAGVVGVMMAMVMGVRDTATLRRASDLGIAFQLTNIARDVIPDAETGRCYLPASMLAAKSLTRADVADPAKRVAVSAVTNELLSIADIYYASAGYGMRALPFRSAWAIAAARRVYRDIGMIVYGRGAAAWDTRARTSKARKRLGVAIAAAEAAAAVSLGSFKSTPERHDLWTPDSLIGQDRHHGAVRQAETVA